MDLGFVDVGGVDTTDALVAAVNNSSSGGAGTTAIARALWGCIKREKNAIIRRKAKLG